MAPNPDDTTPRATQPLAAASARTLPMVKESGLSTRASVSEQVARQSKDSVPVRFAIRLVT
jgi:hypothetical protein